MKNDNQSVFEFKYDGNNFIDLNTLITSQFHFLATFNELQKRAISRCIGKNKSWSI